MMRKIMNVNIGTRMIGLLVLVILFFLGVVLLHFLPTVERELLKDRKQGLKYIAEVSSSLLKEYEQRAKDGEFTRQEAQERAMTRIRQMRFGNNDYLWINDDTLPYPRMIMHPTVPALDGKILDESRFACATRMEFGVGGRVQTISGRDKNLFQAGVEVVKQSGEGFVTYDWPRPTRDGATTELFSKESYVTLYQPWGWVIGTGVYVDDIQAQVARLRWAMLAVMAGIMAVVVALAVFIVLSITRPMNALIRYAESVSQGDLDAEISGSFAAETGRLKTAITKMVHELKQTIGHAEAKSREAEKGAQECKLATEEAEQAKQQAETAKRDGMLEAAANIEGVVERMTSASEELSAQVEEASRGAEEQKNRTAETATAMEEMNATVLEVARNASPGCRGVGYGPDQGRGRSQGGQRFGGGHQHGPDSG
jgi:methyl-accepting chemotaxis protein